MSAGGRGTTLGTIILGLIHNHMDVWDAANPHEHGVRGIRSCVSLVMGRGTSYGIVWYR